MLTHLWYVWIGVVLRVDNTQRGDKWGTTSVLLITEKKTEYLLVLPEHSDV